MGFRPAAAAVLASLLITSPLLVGAAPFAVGPGPGVDPSQFRVKLDQVNDTITSPGEELGKRVSASHNEWVMRTLAFVFGILVFTFGLQYLSRWLETSGSTTYTPRDPNAGFTAGSR